MDLRIEKPVTNFPPLNQSHGTILRNSEMDRFHPVVFDTWDNIHRNGESKYKV